MTAEKPRGWLRDEMPNVAAIVDEFRAAFGAEVITAGIADLKRADEFWCEDCGTGKSYGVRREARGVVPMVYRSQNDLPSMLDVKVSPTAAWVDYVGRRASLKGRTWSMDEFMAYCDANAREFRKGKR